MYTLLCAEDNYIFFLLQALKRDNELYEQQQQQQQLAQKAEQESLAQPDNTNESEILEANRTPDTLLQPIRYACNLNSSL